MIAFLFFIGCKKQNNKTFTSRVSELPYYNEASFTPKWIASNSDELKKFHKIPDFEFINQNGETITQKIFENKIYVTDFFFTTCPGICPMMTKNMHLVQEAFKNDDTVLMLSHSVTPTIDSVPQLKKYAIDKNIGKNWHLVTGNKKEIYDLGRTAYFVENDLGEPKGINDFLHTENFILVDKNKHIRGIYNGLNKNSVKQLIADIKALKKE
ncbi:SCO family protein [Polaribacter reichenbachii]|uniref:Electron transporter n=2 Tax=Polaribacter reichenbachii TaxID=996801 RepID=A0A1B8TQH0_9FLAO|nr:SCO family protein [Polaribacter reichenbachii]APZ48135.1 SCO family protein [Polaribacter reichenbachii]AUC20402.1 SCO family protein [Polaribacter reichenbachii]OBY61804.1 electron transporter [Polaribacter reichenbachii]